jgi:class 3 adenylate cyclase
LDGRDAAGNLAVRYLASMLSAALVLAMLGAFSAWTAGSAALLPALLLWSTVLLVGINLLGALAIYAPVHRHLSGRRVDRAIWERRARRLPVYSGSWVFALTVAAMLAYAAAAHGSWHALTALSTRDLYDILARVIVLAALIGLYGYLLIIDFSIVLRGTLWKLGESLEPRRGRFVRRLVVVIVTVALGPALIALSKNQEEPAATMNMPMAPSMPTGMNMSQMMQGHMRYMTQTLSMDVYGVLLLSVIVAYLLARSLSRPVETLLAAIRRVDSGEIDAKAPVVSDDEFGFLTDRFDRMLESVAERERLQRTFARFVPQSVAASLLKDEGAIAPQEREATVLFTDIESFTRIASGLAPHEVLTLLNRYFGEVAGIIHRYGGVITQFQGDAVLASFNLPAKDPDHARHALAAACEIQRRLGELALEGEVRLGTRMGIASGVVVGGTVGGADRLGYTIHGNTVNLAARLEELNKELATRILLDGRTADLLGAAVKMRAHGEVAIRGFAQRVRLYEPLPD